MRRMTTIALGLFLGQLGMAPHFRHHRGHSYRPLASSILRLWDVLGPIYFHPGQWLPACPRLRSYTSTSPSSPTPVLPFRTHFFSQGSSEYLDNLVTRIDAPLLDNPSRKLLNRLVSTHPSPETPSAVCFGSSRLRCKPFALFTAPLHCGTTRHLRVSSSKATLGNQYGERSLARNITVTTARDLCLS